MYIDAHTHLNSPKIFVDWQKHISDFEDIWWKIIINAWSDEEYNQNWIKIAKEYKWDNIVKSTIGFHPYEVVSGNINQKNLNKKLSDLKNMYIENKEHILAIWEMGIDVHYKWWAECISTQQELLNAQCELARELWLPIIIHSRDDFHSTIEILKDYKDLKIYFHCRWYWPDEIKFLENIFPNIWIGFCANITYPKAQNIRDSLAVVNKNNILLETDAPYLPPQEFRGKTNYPIYVKDIYEFVSDNLNINMSELKEIIKNNIKNIYSI